MRIRGDVMRASEGLASARRLGAQVSWVVDEEYAYAMRSVNGHPIDFVRLEGGLPGERDEDEDD